MSIIEDVKRIEDENATLRARIAEMEGSSKDDPIRIVVAQRGWIYVGRWSQDGDEVTLRDAANIRRWGTTKGLGELFGGPTGKTVLDHAGTVRFHSMSIVLTVDCGSGWSLPCGR